MLCPDGFVINEPIEDHLPTRGSQTKVEYQLIRGGVMILPTIVGVDPHKKQHAVCVLDQRGKPIRQFEIANSPEAFAQLGNSLPEESVIGLEDSEQYGLALAQYLAGRGLTIKVINPIYTKRERFYSPEISKDDARDAELTASVLWREWAKGTLPSFTDSTIAGFARGLRGLVGDYRSLVHEQTRLKNQLHQLLNASYGHCYEDFFKSCFSKTALAFFNAFPTLHSFFESSTGKWQRVITKNSHYRLTGQLTGIKELRKQLKRINPDQDSQLDVSELVVRRLLRKIKQLCYIQEESREVKDELIKLMGENLSAKTLMGLSGAGPVVAAIILSEIKDIHRFSKDAKLARYAGCAPQKHGSGGKFKYYPNHRGNRKLNWAIHRMTLSQLGNRGNPITKTYYQKKLKQGKTKKQAFVACKRQLIKVVFQTLKKRHPSQTF